MTIISTTVHKNTLKKWSRLHSQPKSLKCSTWIQSQKGQNDFCSFSRQIIQYHSNLSHSDGEEDEHFCEDLQDFLELTPPKRCTLHYRDWKTKVGSQ